MAPRSRAVALAIAMAISAALAIATALGQLPATLEWVFKPLTTLLIIAFAWRRGAGLQQRCVRLGLVLSLAGDVALLWPRAGFLIGLVAFLLAHLAYIAVFCAPLRLGARRTPFVVYALMAAAILSWLWPVVPAALRGPVLAYVVCLATMAAQAAAWWQSRAGSGADDEPWARLAAIGGFLFMSSDSLLAVNRFASPLPLASPWILATYWVAQWCIASSLRVGASNPYVVILCGYGMATTTMTSKGQVTIPKAVRQHLGLRQGTRVVFAVEGDHAVLRPAVPERSLPSSGFGLVKVSGPAVPADFDVASLLIPEGGKPRRAPR
jgi:AbrB family looped-hinge helix DNA binding protein